MAKKGSHWRLFDSDDDRFDRVMRMKPRERKSSKSSNLESEFESPETMWHEKFPDGVAARVVEVHKRYAFVSPEPEIGKIKTRDVQLATIARRFLQARRQQRNFIVVGDRVLCTPAQDDQVGLVTELPQCVIQNLAPRKSLIMRRDPQRKEIEHVLASNVDQLLIVASYVSPAVKWGLIDRYLVLAEMQGIKPIIVLNKKDLLSDQKSEFQNECLENVATYKSLGYKVYSIQANTARAKKSVDVKSMRADFEGKISMLSGHSGVGKSSLVNLFSPELVQPVEKNDDIFYKGRHTTSYASFIKLGTGGYVIDTPGIRSFVLQEFTHRELASGFVEFQAFLGRCRYQGCRHIDEPECAVRQAMVEGLISCRRYESYRGILLGTTGREGRIRDSEIDSIQE
jgi:ribosome biogenesis GTPase / thiamine phosphate phosphatase